MQILVSHNSFSYTVNFPAGEMDAIIQQILLFLVFINFPKTILSEDSCPSSSCPETINYFSIRYPFKFQADPLPKHCQDYINLRCNNDKGRVVINLPASGDFYVTGIYYSSKAISLSDPENCLPKRLMTSFSLSPLGAFHYENYTYYLCPRDNVEHSFSEIKCLSNSTNVTIARTSTISSELMEKMYRCKAIVSSMIPVLSTDEYEFQYSSEDLYLTWNVSGCKDCERGFENSGASSNKWKTLVGSPLSIPSSIVLVAFLGATCFMRVMAELVLFVESLF